MLLRATYLSLSVFLVSYIIFRFNLHCRQKHTGQCPVEEEASQNHINKRSQLVSFS